MNNIFDDVFYEYGNLTHIVSPKLVSRYNAALKELTGKETTLTSFHVDCSGFSPEIAEELQDPDYLDAHGVNKKFILITMEQVEADIVSTHFSSTMYSLKGFYSENFKSLSGLTAKDAVIGELDNKQFKPISAGDLISSNTIHIKVDTANGLLRETDECMSKVACVLENDIWDDDDMLDQIIEHSHRCGSLLKNAILPRNFSYRRHSYYTRHFGGMYVFSEKDKLSVIVCDPEFDIKKQGLEDASVIFIQDEDAVFSFLNERHWLQDIDMKILESRIESFELKQYHSVLDEFYRRRKGVAVTSELDVPNIKNFIYANHGALGEDFALLSELVTALANGRESKIRKPKFKWYTTQVHPELPDALKGLISHLLCNFSTYSYFRLFVFNRERFEKLSESWSEEKNKYIRNYILNGKEVIEDLYNTTCNI